MKYPIPDTALAQHIGLLGKTGSGKTTVAKAGAEMIIDAGGRVCVLDPTGAWWGMKSSASGKSAGYPVVIFGGLHGDLPLDKSHGEAIAEIVGTTSTPTIIDTSQMKVSERTRFFTDFADAIMRKNRGPLHLIIDEAHVFMPQGKVPDPASGAMLAAGNNIVSGGRSRGLRIMLITQRPAKLHKDSLTQVETLVAMRLIAPQDRKAVEEWIKDNADPAKGREIIESLATLKTGQGWVWAPEVGLLERVTFPRIKTFDSSAAPTHHDGDKGPVLAAIDKDAILSKLKMHAEYVAANDPPTLKAKIADLERQLKSKQPNAVATDAQIERARKAGWEECRKELNALVSTKVDESADSMRAISKQLTESAASLVRGLSGLMKVPHGPATVVASVRPTTPVDQPVARSLSAANGRQKSHTGDGSVSAAGRKILTVLAQHRDGCTAGKLALLTGYRYSGGFRNALSELRVQGLITGANNEVMQITDDGLAHGPFSALPTGAELASYWYSHNSLGKCAKDVLRMLVDNPDGMTAADLASETGYEYSGGFRNALSELRTAGVLVGKNTETMRASEDLLS